ncbi:restriction endonuclease [Aurantivibrio plasticivorans]
MPVPNYRQILRPFLAELEDGETKSMQHMREAMAVYFNLTPEDLAIKIPSGQTTLLRSRVGWSRTYLHKAKLITLPKRAHCQITDRGRQALIDCPEQINGDYLKTFPEYLEFVNSGKKKSQSDEASDESEPLTPDEQIGQAYQTIKNALASQILDSIKSNTPGFFEDLVVDLMLAMGYGGANAESGRATQQTNDNGIDGVINEDKLGLDTIYLQAKRWENTVHRPEIDKFIGALTRQGARKGVFITTSDFSEGAREAATGLNISIVLIDGQQLAKLMIDNDIGVNITKTYNIRSIDTDYFIQD